MGIVEAVYRKKLVHRYDDEGYIKYFSAADFPGLQAEPFRFTSVKNTLRGFWYRCGGERNELIVFCHGVGGGHRSYMTEIALLCGRGYTVLAYDNTGCFDSGGRDIGGFGQSLADLDAAVKALKADGAWEKFSRVFVMGHSWGGYAAANIPKYQSGFEKAVVISGFVSVERMLLTQTAGAKTAKDRFTFRRLCAFEKKACPAYFGANALDAVNEGKTKYLFAHSKDDPVVPYAEHTRYIRENAKSDAEYLIVSGRMHNPNYTADAVVYMSEVLGGFQAAQKAGKMKTLDEKEAYFKDTDWRRMTAQDEGFWDRVCAFLQA